MKNNLFAAVFVALVTLLSACSESGSVPNQGLAANGLQQPGPYGYQTGLNPGYNNNLGYNQNTYNPYLQYQNGNYNQLNMQAQMQLQLRANAMFTCQARLNPYFYYTNMNSNNCTVRTQPTYTPYSCACIQAPCDCAKVVSQVRSQCRYTPVTTTRTNTRDDDDDTRTSNTVDNDGIDTNTKTLLLTVYGADARALYERLAREEKDVQGRKKAHTRTGTNYKCMKDGNKDEASDDHKKTEDYYACDIDIVKSDGTVYEQHPIGKLDNAMLSGVEYSGKNVTASAGGNGSIRVTGAAAKDLYKKLSPAGKDGTPDVINGAKVNVKLGKQAKCHITTATSSPVAECIITLKIDTGEALEAK